jgi:protoheme IX farnesyltransferase
VRDYLQLTKPGMVAGNLLPALGAFLLASQGSIDWGLLLSTMIGLGLIIAAACTLNNYIDRGIDSKMKRTKKRSLVSGAVKPQQALIFGHVLLAAGVATLALFTNWLTLAAALVGYFGYVFIYGYAKRRSSLSTLIGGIPGAMPPVVGYVAVSGHLDAAAVILFLILFVWQLPHFYAISIYRRSEYAAADLPVMSVSKGIPAAKKQILIYVFGFGLIVPLLWIYGYTGYVYLVVVFALAVYWLRLCFKGYFGQADDRWARQMFGFSLIVLLVFSTLIGLNAWLP